jgi:integrase
LILKASILHRPTDTGNPKTTESPHTTATINWVPLICAFTGARPSEITQARAEDFRAEEDFNVLRITPEAGTVKTGMYRDVPLHPQLVELGLMKFIAGKSGPLFHANDPRKDASRAAKVMSGKLAGWLQAKNLIPKDMQPNYGWRHRFKTQTNELEITVRVADAIQGHPGKTAADNYGEINLKTRWNAIQKFPRIPLG